MAANHLKYEPLIAKRLIVYVVLFSVLVTLSITVINLSREYNNDVGQIGRRVDEIHKAYSESLSQAVRLQDKNKIRSQLQALLAMPSVDYVAVYDSEKKLLDRGIKPKTNYITRTLTLNHSRNNTNKVIGTVKTSVSLSDLSQGLYRRFWVLLGLNGMSSLLVAGFILWLYRCMLTRHLRQLAKFVAEVRLDRDKASSFEGKSQFARGEEGEIDFLAKVFHEMQQQLRNFTVERELVLEKGLEQKQNESQLLADRENLEELVQARTREIELVNQELESFSYSVSHDLRAPLRAIEGFSKILKEELRSADVSSAQDWVERIEKNSRRMSLLIDDLLKLSRVMRGDLDLKRVDLSAVIDTVVKRLGTEDPERELVLHIEEGMVVTADSSLLEVVLSNLLENAWKYSSREKVTRIDCNSVLRKGVRYFCIRDNGVGLNMKYADKLFSPFQRLHAKEDFPGTGIGLATVKRILNRHNGDIFVEAKEGEGASFYFSFTGVSNARTKYPQVETSTG